VSSHEDVVAEDVQLGSFLLPLSLFSHGHWNQIMSANKFTHTERKKKERKESSN